MATKLYVGSLAYSVKDEELEEFFASVGSVVSAVVIKDKFSGQSKGFGFVEMSSEKEAKEAIKELNEKELGGRPIRVSEAREPREGGDRGGDRRPQGGRGGRDGGNSFRRR